MSVSDQIVMVHSCHHSMLSSLSGTVKESKSFTLIFQNKAHTPFCFSGLHFFIIYFLHTGLQKIQLLEISSLFFFLSDGCIKRGNFSE